MSVRDRGWTWDGTRDSGRAKDVKPPGEVCRGVPWCMMGNKGAGNEGSHKAFQTGEVSTAGREDKASVEKLAVKLLGFVQAMGGMWQPIFDRCPIFSLFPV